MAMGHEQRDAFIKQAFEDNRLGIWAFFRMAGGLQDNDADDCLQEVFLKAWRCREQLRDLAAVKAWLKSIANSVLGDFRRQGKRQPVSLDCAEQAAGSTDDGPDACFKRAEIQRKVAEAMAGLIADNPTLDDKKRTARRRLYEVAKDWMEGYFREYTAKRMKCSIKTVERAREELKAEFSQQLAGL